MKNDLVLDDLYSYNKHLDMMTFLALPANADLKAYTIAPVFFSTQAVPIYAPRKVATETAPACPPGTFCLLCISIPVKCGCIYSCNG